jgi:hypothetical protein
MTEVTLEELLDERKELEQRALEWADRWLAASPGMTAESALACVRPISFYRAEVEAAYAAARIPPHLTTEN